MVKNKAITVALSLTFLLSNFAGSSQFLKTLTQKAKENARWRLDRTENQKINQGMDSLETLTKKMKDKTREKQAGNPNDKAGNASGGDPTQRPREEEDMSQKDGYVTLTLSATNVFAGGTLSISGESILYKNYNQVEVTVAGNGQKDTRSIPLSPEGKFTAVWYASDKTGEFTVTVKGSDRKSSQSSRFTVYQLARLEGWCDENISTTNKAYDKLKEAVQNVQSNLGSNDKQEMDKKLEETKEKVDKLLKLYNDLNIAGKQIAAIARSGKNLSPGMAGNLSDLNDRLADQRKKMEQIEEYNNHEPADNTVCEYLVVANEACAAFQVYTNIEGLAIKGILKNILLDKVVPATAGMVNQQAKHNLSEPNDFLVKEPSKIFSQALLDVDGLNSQLGTAGFCGDILQFATDVLMKKYCGVFKGTIDHDYTIEFRNNKGQNWWTYGVKMRAVVALRYPKVKAGGDVIKMKGNLEGNATKFSFFEDVEKDDDFQEGSNGKIEVVPLKVLTPLSVSFATSEKDILGFGALARGLASPAYFNIPIDAEYDVNKEKIKIFINPAIVDFSIYVSNKLIFALVGGDMLPYLKQMNFPIHKAGTTIGSVVRGNNEFDVKKDKNGNLSFSGKVNKHLGSKDDKIVHDLNFTITAAKQ